MEPPVGASDEKRGETASRLLDSSQRQSFDGTSTRSSDDVAAPFAASQTDSGQRDSPRRTVSSFSFVSLASAVSSLRNASSESLLRRVKNQRSQVEFASSGSSSSSLSSSNDSSSSSSPAFSPSPSSSSCTSSAAEHTHLSGENEERPEGRAGETDAREAKEDRGGRLDDSRIDEFDLHGALVFDDYEVLNYPATSRSISTLGPGSNSTSSGEAPVTGDPRAETRSRNGVGASREEKAQARDFPAGRELCGDTLGTAECMQATARADGADRPERQTEKVPGADVGICGDGTSLLVEEEAINSPRPDCTNSSRFSSSRFPFFWSSSTSSSVSSVSSSSSSSSFSFSTSSGEASAVSRGSLRGTGVSSLSRETRFLWHPLITRCVYGPLVKARFYLMMHPGESTDAVVVLRLSDFLVRYARSTGGQEAEKKETREETTEKSEEKKQLEEEEKKRRPEEGGRRKGSRGRAGGEADDEEDCSGARERAEIAKERDFAFGEERGDERAGRGSDAEQIVAVDVTAVEQQVLQIFRRKPQGIVMLNDLPLSCLALKLFEEEAKAGDTRGAKKPREREGQQVSCRRGSIVSELLPASCSHSGSKSLNACDLADRRNGDSEDQPASSGSATSRKRAVLVPFTQDVFSSSFLHAIAAPLGVSSGGSTVSSDSFHPRNATQTPHTGGDSAPKNVACSPGSSRCPTAPTHSGRHAETQAERSVVNVEEGQTEEEEEEEEEKKEEEKKRLCEEAALAAALEAAREAAARQDGDFEGEEARLAAEVQRHKSASAFRQNFLFEDEVEEKDDEWIDARKQGNSPVVLLVMRRGTDLAHLAELDGIRHACITPIPLQLGDHIYRAIKPRGILSIATHHGIYAGHGRVFHLSGNERQGLWALLANQRSARVRVTSIRRFMGRGRSALRVKRYKEEQCDDPFTVIQRAEESFVEQSFPSYHLLFNNCEHFAVFCKTGKGKSSQVEKAAVAAVATTSFLVGAGATAGAAALAAAVLERRLRRP
ncbi:lecithin retinol acyltransferase [Toxoplasma gondii MAS]|uniref:Lecithin retinol acyltransferase n=1 Tax=Toxoplasma gondii MAS TaxID=943118 RepID=A0A086QYE0_TOXGO|nr:lecithin retinol acyltransferase [Toxoplasma gondii MAS]